MNRPRHNLLASAVAGVAIAGAVTLFGDSWLGSSFIPAAEAAGGKVTDPNGTAPDRYVYYPGTEPLGKDEIRLFACGESFIVDKKIRRSGYLLGSGVVSSTQDRRNHHR